MTKWTRKKVIECLEEAKKENKRPNFSNEDLSGLNLRYLKFDKADFIDAELGACNFTFSEFLNCDFSMSSANHADFKFARLAGSNFHSASLYGCEFYESAIANCNFSEAFAATASFREAIIAASCFDSADLFCAAFNQSEVTLTDFVDANLKGAMFGGSNFGGVTAALNRIRDIALFPTSKGWMIHVYKTTIPLAKVVELHSRRAEEADITRPFSAEEWDALKLMLPSFREYVKKEKDVVAYLKNLRSKK